MSPDKKIMIEKEWLQKEFLPEHKAYYIRRGRKLERTRLIRLFNKNMCKCQLSKELIKKIKKLNLDVVSVNSDQEVKK